MRVAMITGAGQAKAEAETADAQAERDHVEALAAGLGGAGHEVQIYSGAGHPDGVNAPVIRVPERFEVQGDPLANARAFGAWLRRHWESRWSPDVVHAHYYVSGLAGMVATNDGHTPLVETFHRLSPLIYRRPFDRRSESDSDVRRLSHERLVGARASAVIARSRDEIDRLVALSIPRSTIALVPDAVDDVRFCPDGAERSRDRIRVLSVGPLDGGSGHADAIRALRLIPDTELVIIGDSAGREFENDPNVRMLGAVARETGVLDRVVIVGAVDVAKLSEWYRSAAALVCGARDSARATPVLQAMSCGVPVVAYDIAVFRDLVVDGVTGDLVAPGDSHALGLAVRRLLAQDFRRLQYAAASVDRARHCFSWSRATEQVVHVYRRAVRRVAAR